MDDVSPWVEANNSGLPRMKLPPQYQELVMPMLNFYVFLHEPVMEGQRISDTHGRLAFRPSIAHIQQ